MKAPKFEHKFEAQDLGEFTKQLDESIGMMKMVFGGIAAILTCWWYRCNEHYACICNRAYT